MHRILSATAAFALGVAGPALAGSSATSEYKMEIKFDPAALDRPGSLATEYEQIKSQIEKRCRHEHADQPRLKKVLAVRKCTSQALSTFIEAVENDALSTYHRAQSPRRR